jgi:RNA polymerase sigma-70 factor (ECF subfamily)
VLEQSDRSDWAEELINKYGSKILRTAAAIVGNKADAEDAVQNVFIKLFEKRPRFESAEHEKAWLLRATINHCKNHLRSHWWRKTVPLLDTYPAKGGEQRGVIQSVLALPAKYRTVIHLHYYEGYKTKEIAELTGQKESAVRQLLSRARRMLKVSLEGENQ